MITLVPIKRVVWLALIVTEHYHWRGCLQGVKEVTKARPVGTKIDCWGLLVELGNDSIGIVALDDQTNGLVAYICTRGSGIATLWIEGSYDNIHSRTV